MSTTPSTPSSPAPSRTLVLAAMIFAVSMTFIDQTIVSIAAPDVQTELSLTTTGMQWAINAYLLTLAAFFLFGGRLADTRGHVKVVVAGVVIFAVASTFCGLTPATAIAESWLVGFRALQGVGAALMFPAALAIVVQTYPLERRGRALAAFFGIAGGLTAVGPLLGAFLTQWTWRAIFWVNVPVAIIALVLTAMAKPRTESRPAPIDVRGLVLVAAGVGLSVFGFQQAGTWGWGSPGVWGAVAAGVVLLVVFVLVELRTEHPLTDVRIFRSRPFLVENLVLLFSMIAFVPVFFFASVYAQVSLDMTPTNASLVLLYFFLGFVVAAQVGGRILDSRGAKPSVVLGCVIAAVGFFLWAGKVTDLSLSGQVWMIVLTGAGMGLMLGPASTDAVNRAGRLSYGEATGITQTIRNYSASLGLAVLGTTFVTVLQSRITDSLVGQGMPAAQAEQTAAQIAQGDHSSAGGAIPDWVRLDYAYGTQAVLRWMGVALAVSAVIALVGLTRGKQTAVVQESGDAEPATG